MHVLPDGRPNAGRAVLRTPEASHGPPVGRIQNLPPDQREGHAKRSPHEVLAPRDKRARPAGQILLLVTCKQMPLLRTLGLTAITFALAAPFASAMERITLTTGASFDCIRHEPVDGRIRLYLEPTTPGETPGYTDVAPAAIALVETVPDPPPPAAIPAKTLATKLAAVAAAEPSVAELRQLLSTAGAAHNIDAELLASVVHAESNGHAHAISRTGAEGLMQLMPSTASAVGVTDAFVAAENVEGGTRYLDAMLIRYHDNIALALAAYNAGPGAVDKYHGVPPYRETRAYVSRIIREFNRRKLEAMRVAKSATATSLLAKAQ